MRDKARSNGEDTGGLQARCVYQSSPTVELFLRFLQTRRARHPHAIVAIPASLWLNMKGLLPTTFPTGASRGTDLNSVENSAIRIKFEMRKTPWNWARNPHTFLSLILKWSLANYVGLYKNGVSTICWQQTKVIFYPSILKTYNRSWSWVNQHRILWRVYFVLFGIVIQIFQCSTSFYTILLTPLRVVLSYVIFAFGIEIFKPISKSE